MKTILITVSGMSPAIITETLWALATETPAVVPDEVVVITTLKGEEDIQHQLLTPLPDWGDKKVWEHLRRDIFSVAGIPGASRKLQLSIRVIELPDETSGIKTKAYDLRSKSDNAEAADFILQTLVSVVDPDHHVIASIAGGRKTMGALLYASMSLAGRETDRVTHVLVNAPFDSTRGFFYKTQPVQQLQAFDTLTKKTVTIIAEDAHIDLADLPFVPLRNGFREMNEERLSFAGLVDQYSRNNRRPLLGKPRLVLDVVNALLHVEGRKIELAGRNLVVACYLYERALARLPHFSDQQEASKDYAAYLSDWRARFPNHPAAARYTTVGEGDITKALSSLRTKLKAKGLEGCVEYLVPDRKRIGFDMIVE